MELYDSDLVIVVPCSKDGPKEENDASYDVANSGERFKTTCSGDDKIFDEISDKEAEAGVDEYP